MSSLVELEHKDFWAMKLLNFDSKSTREKRKTQLHELEEMRLNAYHSSNIYRERVKAYNDKRILERNFQPGFYSILGLFSTSQCFYSIPG